jgi:hypothetical protein
MVTASLRGTGELHLRAALHQERTGRCVERFVWHGHETPLHVILEPHGSVELLLRCGGQDPAIQKGVEFPHARRERCVRLVHVHGLLFD